MTDLIEREFEYCEDDWPNKRRIISLGEAVKNMVLEIEEKSSYCKKYWKIRIEKNYYFDSIKHTISYKITAESRRTGDIAELFHIDGDLNKDYLYLSCFFYPRRSDRCLEISRIIRKYIGRYNRKWNNNKCWVIEVSSQLIEVFSEYCSLKNEEIAKWIVDNDSDLTQKILQTNDPIQEIKYYDILRKISLDLCLESINYSWDLFKEMILPKVEKTTKKRFLYGKFFFFKQYIEKLK